MAEGKEREFDVVKNERGKSEIWKHFGVKKMKIDGSIEDSTAVCFSCQSSLKTGGGTSNLTSHLRRHHPQLLTAHAAAKSSQPITQPSQQPQPAKRQQTLLSSFKAGQQKYPPNSPRSKAITQQIAKFLVKDMRPYRLVDTPYFRNLLAMLDEKYQCPSRKHFSEIAIPTMYDEVKAQVLTKLRRTEQVSIWH